MNRDQTFMSGARLWLVVGIAGGVAVVSYFMSGSVPKDHEPVPLPVEPPAMIENEALETTEPEGEGLILPPAPEAEAPKPQPEVIVSLPPERPPKPVAPGLPLLEGSDPEIYRGLAGTVRDPDEVQLKGLLAPKDRIRRFVTTMTNLGDPKVPRRHLPVRSVPGSLVVKRTLDGRLAVDEANFRRYTPYVELLEAIDAEKLVKVYAHLSPLFDEAYRDLGFPKGGFNDPLLAGIDRVLAAPEQTGELIVKRLSANYVFVDKSLEALPEIDKLMARMGPDNARRVKTRLRALRAQLATKGRQ